MRNDQEAVAGDGHCIFSCLMLLVMTVSVRYSCATEFLFISSKLLVRFPRYCHPGERVRAWMSSVSEGRLDRVESTARHVARGHARFQLLNKFGGQIKPPVARSFGIGDVRGDGFLPQGRHHRASFRVKLVVCGIGRWGRSYKPPNNHGACQSQEAAPQIQLACASTINISANCPFFRAGTSGLPPNRTVPPGKYCRQSCPESFSSGPRKFHSTDSYQLHRFDGPIDQDYSDS